MSEPTEPTPPADPTGADQTAPLPPTSGGRSSSESEPAPTTAAAAEPPPAEPSSAPNPSAPPPGAQFYPPYAMPPRQQRFGRFVRHRATQLVAAVIAGALIGGGTVAVFDNVASHNNDNARPYHRHGGHPGPNGYQLRPAYPGPGQGGPGPGS